MDLEVIETSLAALRIVHTLACMIRGSMLLEKVLGWVSEN